MSLFWYLACLVVLLVFVPLLFGAVFNKSDRTEERRETERGDL